MESLAGIFVMVVTMANSLAPQANLEKVLGVNTQLAQNTRLEVQASIAPSLRPRVSQALLDAQTRRETVRENVQERLEAAKERVIQNRVRLQNQLQLIQDENKRRVVENIAERVEIRNEYWVMHWNNVLERLSEILAKIEDRADRAQQAGLDTTDLTQSIREAQTAISDAQTAVTNQASKVYSINITDETTLREDVQEVIGQYKADLETVQSAIRAARAAVQDCFEALRLLYPQEVL